MQYSLEYYVNYWGPFAISLIAVLFFMRFALKLQRERVELVLTKANELIDLNKKSVSELTEIKKLLEDRKA